MNEYASAYSPPGKQRRKLLKQGAPVVRRWMSRRMSLAAKAAGRRIARRRLPRSERERRRTIAQAFATTKYYASRSEQGGFPAVALLFNIALYLLIAERDIQSVKIDALTHPDEWVRKLNARVILLTIYEWDADKVSGRALRDALDQIEATDDLKADAFAALRALRAVQTKATKRFSFIRNAAIAHRDPNALVQYRAIRDLSVEDVVDVSVEFYDAVGKFIGVLTQLMEHSSSLKALLDQWQPGRRSPLA